MKKSPIPIGIDSFAKLRRGGFRYIDKTRMIHEFLEQAAEVTLITRPRRFGKTLNLDMMREFFNIQTDSRRMFQGLEVMNGPYAEEINSRPVLFFTFKDCKDGWPLLMRQVKTALEPEFERYRPIVYDGLSASQKRNYDEILDTLADKSSTEWAPLWNAIAFLSRAVSEHYQKPVLILIDEYDTPLSAAHTHGCYEPLHSFFSSLYSTSLKGSPYLDMALMTGIQRVAKENIFSGLNNLLVCTAENSAYAECFGFTPGETQAVLEEYGLSLNEAVSKMYDGYRFGGSELYNPWSILNYAKSGQMAPYWVNTSSNELLHSRLGQASAVFQKQFDELIIEGSVTTMVDLQTGTYDGGGDAALWGLFVNAGYLTFAEEAGDPTVMRQIRIPNGEVQDEFKEIVARHMGLQRSRLDELFHALVDRRDPETFSSLYRDIITTVTSYHDDRENAYHMLLLGMCVYLEGRYEIHSNRESGMGRSDILLKAKQPRDWNIIVELKQGVQLSKLALAALDQMAEKQYAHGLTGEVLLLGIAHHGKSCEIQYRTRKEPSEDLVNSPAMGLK